jgi:hypothetical protein
MPGAAADDVFEIAVERDRVSALTHLPVQSLGGMQFFEEHQRAPRRRLPFQRPHMCERVEPALVGGEQCGHCEIVHDGGKAWRLIVRVFGIGQGVVPRQEFARRDQCTERLFVWRVLLPISLCFQAFCLNHGGSVRQECDMKRINFRFRKSKPAAPCEATGR